MISSGRGRNEESGQLYTLEGVAAAAVLLLGMTFALNSFVVSPTSDVNPGTDTNQRVGEDLLAVAAENNATGTNNSKLKEALLNWNVTAGGFENSTDGVYYYEGEDPDPAGLEFGEDLQNVLTEEGVSYDIDASFGTDDGNSTGEITIVDGGEPTTSALSASSTVVLLDDDNVTKATAPDGKVNLVNTTRYPIPDDRATNVYNQVRVRLTVWT